MVASKKCMTQGCHKRTKLTDRGRVLLESEHRRVGRRPGLLCPDCVKRAFDDPEHYAVNIPLGEVITESMRSEPHWHVAFPPAVQNTVH